MKSTIFTSGFKTFQDITTLQWHLQNNVMPVLNAATVTSILKTIDKLNTGTLTINDKISDNSECTIYEMCQDLKIDLVEAY